MSGFRWSRSTGRWLAAEGVPLTDRGFRHGAGLFETIAVRRGTPIFWEQHLERLREAGASFGFPELPSELIFPEVDATADGSLRLHWTAGDGRPADPVLEPRLFAAFEPTTDLVEIPASVRVTIAPLGPDPTPGKKTHLYWPRLRILEAARAEGWDEVLLTDASGGILTGAVSNVFARVDGRWVTPATNFGIRPGVVREWVRDASGAEESGPLPADGLEEVFLTNSRIGILPVSELDGRRLSSTEASEKLRESYQREILDA